MGKTWLQTQKPRNKTTVYATDAAADSVAKQSKRSFRCITLLTFPSLCSDGSCCHQHMSQNSRRTRSSHSSGCHVTLALSCSLENSPLHRMQCSAATSRKQSPLFSDLADGSTRRTWTCRLPVAIETSGQHESLSTERWNKIEQIFYDLWREWASGCCREDKTPLLRRKWRFLSSEDVSLTSSWTLWGSDEILKLNKGAN